MQVPKLSNKSSLKGPGGELEAKILFPDTIIDKTSAVNSSFHMK